MKYFIVQYKPTAPLMIRNNNPDQLKWIFILKRVKYNVFLPLYYYGISMTWTKYPDNIKTLPFNLKRDFYINFKTNSFKKIVAQYPELMLI